MSQRNSLHDYQQSQGAAPDRGAAAGSRRGGRSGNSASSSIRSTAREREQLEQEQQQRDRSRSPSPSRPSAQVRAAHQAALAPFYAEIRGVLEESGHERLRDHLHPDRLPGTKWFTDNSVASAVTDVFEKDYQDPYTKWSEVKQPALKRWFGTFAHKYHWESGFTPRVYEEFCAKVRDRLPDMAYRKKQQWMAKGDGAKPPHWEQDVWDRMVAAWLTPDHQKRSDNGKSARGKSKNSTHRSGRTGYAARARLLAEERGDSETDLLEVLAYAKRRPDGTFMDEDSENLYHVVNSQLEELTQNDDPDSIASASSVALKNKLFLQSAPCKKGKIRGVGSLHSQIDIGSGYVCSSGSSQQSDPFEVAQLKEKLAANETKLTATQSKVNALEQLFDYFGNSDPKFKELLDRTRQNQQQDEGQPSEPDDGGSGPSDAF